MLTSQISDDLLRKCVNTLKFLAIDGVEKAKSGHPGLPMGAADMAWVLWSKFLNVHGADPHWMGRDRFVLSAGHGSMLLYSLLNLWGYDLPMDELKRFRQWGSKTPGHPEYGHTAGVETTTGPLGQGFAHGVGMAIAQKHLSALFATPAFDPVASRIWGIVSDGDLMEGVSAEAASVAGHLGLDNLIYLYDSNRITIDGSTEITFTEDVGKRFEAYGWFVQHVNGHDHAEVEKALATARDNKGKPSLIVARTTIGNGAPNKAGSPKVHGAPLGADEMAKTRALAGWSAETFQIPADVQAVLDGIKASGKAAFEAWNVQFSAWRQANPEKAKLWDAHFVDGLPADLEEQLIAAAGPSGIATRSLGGKVINKAADLVPGLMGGSADLDESTMTFLKDKGIAHPGHFEGRNVHFGIREHAMGAIANGLTLFGLRGFTATFLVFSDYMRPPIRLAALMHLPVIYVFTHDSVFLGEDGPTHQPVEHYAALRVMPNVEFWRPGDARETALAWAGALRRTDGPSVIALTRQKMAPYAGTNMQVPANGDQAAAYIVHEPEGGPLEAILIATGSETALAIEGAKASGRRVRVVSMPCVERFLKRPREVQETLLPKGVPTASIESGRTDLWRQFTGRDGLNIGIDTFGHSAPAEVIAEELGFTPAKVAASLNAWLS